MVWVYVPYQSWITDYGHDRRVVIGSVAGEIVGFVGEGEPIHLMPGKSQRIIFAWDSYDGLALPARTATVRVWVYPRRRNI
jgi:hypothetical protein